MSLLFAISPFAVITLGALLLMLVEAFSSDPKSSDLALGAAITLVAGGLMACAVFMAGGEVEEASRALAPHLLMDRFALYFDVLICFGGAVAALLAGGYLPEHQIDRAEFYPLLLLSTVGAMALASAGDLLSLFLGLETMSLGVYAMTGLRRGSPWSIEAAMKYFLLGSFAAAVLLYGGALVYGATGHTDLSGIGASIASGGRGFSMPLLIIGMMLLLVGLAFKVSAVPFHMWTPDAYEGAPTPATAFMAVAVKCAAFAALLRVLLTATGAPRASVTDGKLRGFALFRLFILDG